MAEPGSPENHAADSDPAPEPATASPDLAERIIDAAMRLAADQGWRHLTLADIAAAAEMPLGDLHRQFASRQAILEGLRRSIDRAMMAPGAVTVGPARDRLFEVLMRRFDALERWRPGIAAVLEDQSRDPVALLGGGAGLVCSMATALETAGLDSSGLRGLLRAQALAGAWLPALRVWLGDEGEDRAKTMASLDRGLRRLDRVARFCQGVFTARRHTEEAV
ncbi:MAG: helix-turn-helix domain-containing protein [Dongiaceae bacterium]